MEKDCNGGWNNPLPRRDHLKLSLVWVMLRESKSSKTGSAGWHANMSVREDVVKRGCEAIRSPFSRLSKGRGVKFRLLDTIHGWVMGM